jgi:hypothetical protein
MPPDAPSPNPEPGRWAPESAKTQTPTSDLPDTRLWWLRGGFWYPLLPLISLGYLTSIPFFHAYRRLRDRKILIQGLIYCAATVLYLIITSLNHQRLSSSEWLKDIEAVLLFYPIIGGTLQLAKLRRRVYLRTLEPPHVESYAPDETRRAEIESRSSTERGFRRLSDWAVIIAGVAFFSFLIVAIPVAAIVLTLTGRANFVFGTTNIVYNVPYIIVALGAALVLIGWLAVSYKPDDRMTRHLAALTAAVSVNIYLGFSIWLVATKVIYPGASPHKLGLMVWWNLSDSIPFVNVNSALNWEQPLTEYGAGIGWLFLFQRIVFLLTLARVIQILVHRWITYSKPKPSRPDDYSKLAARLAPNSPKNLLGRTGGGACHGGQQGAGPVAVAGLAGMEAAGGELAGPGRLEVRGDDAKRTR